MSEALTATEKAEFEDLNGFVELLGVSEMSDREWDRYIELLRKVNGT